MQSSLSLAQALRAKHAEALREEIRRDQAVLAEFVAAHGDPAAELRELWRR